MIRVRLPALAPARRTHLIAGVDPGDLLTLQSLGHAPEANYTTALKPDGLNGTRIGVLRQLFGSAEEDKPAVALIDAAIAEPAKRGATIIDPLPTGVDLWQRVRDVSGGDGRDNRAGLEEYFVTRGPAFPIRTHADLLASGGVLAG